MNETRQSGAPQIVLSSASKADQRSVVFCSFTIVDTSLQLYKGSNHEENIRIRRFDRRFRFDRLR